MSQQKKGFNRLDFNEARRVGALVGFDVRACACKKKSCGPGSDWLVQDKRYFVLMLIKHIDGLRNDSAATLSEDVQAWYKKAKAAAQEYARMEEALYPVLTKNRNRD